MRRPLALLGPILALALSARAAPLAPQFTAARRCTPWA